MNMAVAHDQYRLIAAGTKTIEIRLNDAKRRQLRPGNHITFTDLDTGAKVTKQVAAIDHFASFTALYTQFNGQAVGAEPGATVAELTTATYTRYTPTQEQAAGVLAIHLK